MVYSVGDAGHVAEHNQIDADILAKATPESVAQQINTALLGQVVGLTGPAGAPGQDGQPGAASVEAVDNGDGTFTLITGESAYAPVAAGATAVPADDTAYVQSQITTATTASKRVTFRKGVVYALNATITLPAGADVDFGGATLKRTGVVAFDMLVASGVAGITIRNVILDGDKATGALVNSVANNRFSGLRLTSVTDSVLENVTVINTVNGEEQANNPALFPAAGIFFDQCVDITARGLNGWANGGTAVHVNRSSRVHIDGSLTYGNAGSGITSAASPECSYSRIVTHDNGYSNLSVNGQRCRVANVLSYSSAMSGVNVGHTASPSDDTILTGITSYANTFEGITVTNTKRVAVTGFEVHANARNNIRMVSGEGCRFVSGVSRDSAGGQGIYLEAGAGHSVTDCDVSGNAVCGINVNLTAHSVSIGPGVRCFNNGMVTSAGSAGVLVNTANNARLVGVECFDDQGVKTQESGVWLATGTGHVLVGTRVEGNKTNQVRTTGGSVYVQYEGTNATGGARITASSLVVAAPSVGFYGVAPVPRAAVVASPASDTAGTKAAIDAIRVALQGIGITL